MPDFMPRSVAVEAHQWRSNLAALPLEIAAAVSFQGRLGAFVQTMHGLQPLPELSWIVRGVDGLLEVLADGPFQSRYQPAEIEPEPVLSVGTLTLKGKRT